MESANHVDCICGSRRPQSFSTKASAQNAIGSGTKQTSVCLRPRRLHAAVVQLCWVLALTIVLGGEVPRNAQRCKSKVESSGPTLT